METREAGATANSPIYLDKNVAIKRPTKAKETDTVTVYLPVTIPPKYKQRIINVVKKGASLQV